MSYKIDSKLMYVLAGGLLFNFLFWKEELALNLVMYSLFLLTIYLISYKLFENKKLMLIAISHVFACTMLLVNHSIVNMLTWYI